MPVLDGFDVVETLARTAQDPPLIVFVTAYPKFAADAFDSGAIDFLTKPVRLGRLEMAMARVARAIDERSAGRRLAELAGQLAALRAERAPGAQADDSHLWVQRRGEMVRVDLGRVDWIRAEGDYVRLHLGAASYLHREPISEIAARLDPARFSRTHRSYIVNRERVVSVRRSAKGGYTLVTDSGEELPVGRSYRQRVREFVTGG
jgi:DNA-binding LytR/AlgR family response regulator